MTAQEPFVIAGGGVGGLTGALLTGVFADESVNSVVGPLKDGLFMAQLKAALGSLERVERVVQHQGLQRVVGTADALLRGQDLPLPARDLVSVPDDGGVPRVVEDLDARDELRVRAVLDRRFTAEAQRPPRDAEDLPARSTWGTSAVSSPGSQRFTNRRVHKELKDQEPDFLCDLCVPCGQTIFPPL